MVVGLEAKPELNGRRGTIKSYDEAKGRYGVALEGGDSMLLKRGNLVVDGASTEVATAEGAAALPAGTNGVTNGSAEGAEAAEMGEVGEELRRTAALAHVEMAQVGCHRLVNRCV